MMKRIILIVAVAFTCTSFLMLVSCAQKTVETGIEQPTVTEEKEVKEEPKKEVEPTTPAREEEKTIASREEELPGKKVEIEKYEVDKQAEIREFEAEKIYFDFDKSDLKPEALAVLQGKAEWLRKNPEFLVRIEGHCDERGTNEYNMALGDRRANAAWKYLNALGISGSRLHTISYGEERPADPGHNEDAWSKNRRDQFKLMETE